MDHMNRSAGGQMPGEFHSSSFVMSNIGGNVQRYQSQTMSNNRGGTAYTETKQAYSDSSGYEKAGWERHIDKRGHKVVKERRPNTRELTHTTFNNIQPEQEEEFNQQWTNSSHQRLQAPNGTRVQARLSHNPSASSPVHIHVEEGSAGGGPVSRRGQSERRNRMSDRQGDPVKRW
jgi:hypothetical protein